MLSVSRNSLYSACCSSSSAGGGRAIVMTSDPIRALARMVQEWTAGLEIQRFVALHTMCN